MKKIIFAPFVFFCAFLYAQDIHFSQFNASPINLNPALAGVFNGDYRFIGNYRNQWLAVPVPYNSYSLSGDMKLPFKTGKDGLGAGVIINEDEAGDADFGTRQVSLSFSYIKKLDRAASRFLSFGLQTGISGKNFNVNKLTFDNQYNGSVYDPGIASIENFSTVKTNYFDASFGVNWLYKIRQRTSLNVGSSVFHITAPQQSFLSDRNIKLDRKFLQHTALQVNLNAGMDLVSSLMYARQGRFSEVVLGSSLKYFLHSNVSLATAVYLGVYYRGKDAVILTSGMDYDNFTLGISYDVNASGLTPASRYRGGFELSLVYIIQKFTPLKSGRANCPVFM